MTALAKLPGIIGSMLNFADVADRCELTEGNAPAAIRAWANQLAALSARASAGEGERVWKLVGTEMRPIEQEYEVGVMPKVPKPTEWETLYFWEAKVAAITKNGKPPVTAAPQPAQAGASGGEFVLPAGWCTLAVGDGSGRLFVHGPYDAIKAAQAQILSKPPVLATPASPATGGKRHVGDSKFESWYADYCRTDWPDGTKQIARDAYAAGMGDATPQPAAAQGGDRKPWRNHDAAMDAKALATAQEIALMWGQDRSQFVSRIQVAVLDAMRWIAEGSAAPRPQEAPAERDPETCQRCGKAFFMIHQCIAPSSPPAHGDGEVDPDSSSFKEGFSVGRAESVMMCELLRDPKCSRCGARNAIEAETLCRPSEDSCPGSEWPLSNIWALTTHPTPEAQEARDAARYRWLRERWGRISETYMGESSQMDSIGYDEGGWEVDPTSLDGCIDAALALPAQGEVENG